MISCFPWHSKKHELTEKTYQFSGLAHLGKSRLKLLIRDATTSCCDEGSKCHLSLVLTGLGLKPYFGKVEKTGE